MNEAQFKSTEEIEEVFETDRPFAEESLAETLGRRSWVATRGRAEFLLYLNEIVVPRELIPYIVGAYDQMLIDQYDFILTGLGADRHTPALHHPQENSVEELMEEILERTTPLSTDPEEHSMETMCDLANLADEDLLTRLEQVRNSLPPAAD